MDFDTSKRKTKRPTGAQGNGEVDIQDVSQEVPQVDDVLSEIDKVLKKTAPKPKRRKESQDSCWC